MHDAKRSELSVLVTGGCGFVGSHLVDRLMESNHKVTVIDDLCSGNVQNIQRWISHPNFKFVNQNVTEDYFDYFDHIYHLASLASPKIYMKNQIKTIESNFIGTKKMLDLSVRVNARLLLASSSEIYGDPQVSPQNEKYYGNVNSFGPRACYDEGKRSAEALCFAFIQEKNANVAIARIFNAYGPRMNIHDGRIISNFITQALQSKELTIYGDGTQTRSLQYINDLIDGLVALISSEHVGPMNLGSSDEHSILHYAKVITNLVGSTSIMKFLPALPDDPKRRSADSALAENILKWKPKVPLEKGINLTVDYIKSVLYG